MKITTKLPSLRLGLSFAALSLLSLPSIHAANIWDGGGADDNWNTAANWDDDTVPVFPVGLTFDGVTRLTPNNDLSAVTVNSLTFNAGAGAFTIGGNSFTLGTAVAGTALTNNSAFTQTVNAPVVLGNNAQTIALTTGGLTLGGAVSAAGAASGITLTGGNVLTANATGTLAGPNGTIALANTANQKFVIGSGATVTGSVSGGGAIGGALQFTDASSTLIATSATNRAFGGTITGAGTLVINSTGASKFDIASNTSGFTGAMEWRAGESRLNPSSSTYTIKLNGTSAANATGVYTNSNGGTHGNNFNVVGNGGYYRFNSGIETLSGAVTGNGQLNLRGNGAATGYNLTGDWTSTNAFGSAFAGILQVSNGAGVVSINSAKSSSAAAAYDLAIAGAVLQTGNAVTTASLGSLKGVAGSILRGNVTGTSTFTIGALNTDTTFAGTITPGTAVGQFTAINKVGTGTLTLTGANTFTGGTTITGGTINVGADSVPNTFLGTGSVQVNGGGLTLNASGIGTLTGIKNFTLTSGTVTFDIASLSSFDSIAGTGYFALDGGTIKLVGTLVGDGTDTYSILTGFTGSAFGPFAFDTSGLLNLAGRTASLSSSGVLTFAVVPEPSQISLVIVGIFGLFFVLRRRRHTA